MIKKKQSKILENEISQISKKEFKLLQELALVAKLRNKTLLKNEKEILKTNEIANDLMNNEFNTQNQPKIENFYNYYNNRLSTLTFSNLANMPNLANEQIKIIENFNQNIEYPKKKISFTGRDSIILPKENLLNSQNDFVPL